jgi:hypothetical protein
MANQNFNQEKDIEKKVENYAGPEGVTTKQLEYGLWYVEHKQLLAKILYGFLILVSAVSWTYTIYGFAYYLARGMTEDNLLAKELVQTQSADHGYVAQAAAKDLTMGPVQVLSSSGKYDLFAAVTNNNQKWWAEFDYYFVAAGRQTPAAAGYVLPSQTKYLSALAQDLSYQPADASLVIENIRWRRINQHEISDWNSYYQSHLNIASADIKFIPAGVSVLTEKLNLNQLSFTAVNNSAYNYWEVGFSILLYGGDQIVGINHYILSDFMSGQKRPIQLSWPGNLGRVDRVEIIPEINIMKDDIYIKYEGGIGQPSGTN